MTNLHRISVNLSDGQKRKLLRAYQNRDEVTLRLAHSDLSGNDVLFVPAQTVNKLNKHMSLGQGMEIKISQSNIRKQEGSGIFSALMPLAKAVLPTVGKTLGLSALAGAASEGASQLIKKITGGQIFQVPHSKLGMLMQLSHLMNSNQKQNLARANQLGRDLLFKITKQQVGNGIGTILASIGIPLALDVVKKLSGGSAVRMGRSGRGSPRLGAPPPYLGRGKKKRTRTYIRKKFSFPKHTRLGSHIIKYDKHTPMTNFDLIEWCKYLKIPLNNVLSRDQTVPHGHKLALFIYNLEPHYMSGSHWCASFVKNNVINYFDSFGMPPFQEMVNHAKLKNLTLLHQNTQLQNLYSSTCGYFCLYFLNEMNRGIDYFNLLQVFDVSDTEFNEKFIEHYFENLT